MGVVACKSSSFIMVKAFALMAVGAAAMNWDEYKQQFGKVYNGDEDQARQQVFEQNKQMWGDDVQRDPCCRSSFTTGIPRGGVTGYKSASSASALTSALQNGPVSVAIEADQSTFQQYTGGTITSGCGTSLGHGVLAVGINSDGSIKVKNSWGSSWGANGYVNIATNQCGIATDGSQPTVSASVEI